MSNRRRQTLNFALGLLLWVFLLYPLSSYAEDVTWDEETASRMVVALEQARIAEAQLSLVAEGNAELQKQAEILRATVTLLEDQVAIYKSMGEMQQKISDAKDAAFKEQLKAATPTFWDNLGKYTTGGVGGAILAVIIMLL